MTLRLSVEAEEDLITIYVYGAAAFGSAQAERYNADLRMTLELIESTPLIAHERNRFNPPVRIHPHASHLIIYTSDQTGVFVVRILHNRQNWAQVLSDPG
ncbi:type II toxin-antitoxin system RelE/ParE family toxin [Rhizobium sp. CG5]|uniref:type II toxin-antitoxin system RelE/ParE family toxin n=1 Tax=Rhizobium sp. CG5 TaxID=2726076 RepID=UPI002034791A|nr:type II toxin-antitoxin system RelE/ParE family toxin [Rhizobium sp. CG5]MCM2473704.1 type II toxin-antitoxin system RelE/ParE family toxin [Rhizobium sp. CG5]